MTSIDYDFPATDAGGSDPAVVRTNECRYDMQDTLEHDINFNPVSVDNVTISEDSCHTGFNQGKPFNDGNQYSRRTQSDYVRTYSVYGHDNSDFSDTPVTLLTDAPASSLASVVTTKRYIKIIESMSVTIETHNNQHCFSLECFSVRNHV